MKCHYKVLEVETDADDSQIKTAYRKLALKWHPDKNLDNSDYAKEQFQYVQQAYEVLSDRQERAWYDKHRDQILYGKDYEDTALDVFQYFTSTCFKGYSDEPNGFYSVYRQVFENIAREDYEHGENEDDSVEAPSFGNSNSDYDEVVGPFYAYWSSYNTKRSYAWLNPHNIQDVRNRQVFKLMEKENKKVRQKAKKERNEEVRALVAFVRKRDVRVQQNAKRLEAKVLENRQKQEQLSRQKRLERRKELTDEKPLAEWAQFDNIEHELKGIEKQLAETFGEQLSNDDSGSEFDNSLFCVACNKLFKSDKGYQNHEFSKKHRQNVKMIKKTMREEDIQDDEVQDEQETFENGDAVSTGSLDEDDTEINEVTQKKKTKKARNIIQTVYDSDVEVDSKLNNVEDIETSTSFNDVNKKKQKRKSKITNVNTVTNDVEANEEIKSTQNTDEKIKRKEKVKGKLKNKEKNITSDLNNDTDHICVTCKSQFTSKNKLFDHLKKTNHSVQLSAPSGSQNKKKCNK